jgi:t-SNARE complex subunit (syntaxin)
VADYVKQFEQIVMHLPTATQEELQHAFIYGLQGHVRSHVLLNAPSTINEAQTMALTVDDR